MARRLRGCAYFPEKPNDELAALLIQLGLTYQEAKPILLAAELDSFPEGPDFDPIFDAALFRSWEQNERIAELVARSDTPSRIAALKRIQAGKNNLPSTQ